jgi:hypothetical protein
LYAGTSIEGTGLASTKELFQKQVKPVLSQRPDLWPQAASSLNAFVYAAGMVQSRTFHIQQDNWITGQSSEGRCILKGQTLL